LDGIVTHSRAWKATPKVLQNPRSVKIRIGIFDPVVSFLAKKQHNLDKSQPTSGLGSDLRTHEDFQGIRFGMGGQLDRRTRAFKRKPVGYEPTNIDLAVENQLSNFLL